MTLDALRAIRDKWRTYRQQSMRTFNANERDAETLAALEARDNILLDAFLQDLDALLAAGVNGGAQEIVYPTQNTFVFCAHCEHAVLNCPSCGKDEWRIELKTSKFGQLVAKRKPASEGSR